MTYRLLIFDRLPYQQAWDLQCRTADQHRQTPEDNTLITLEHPHTYTIGRRGSRDHLLWTDADQRGITVVDVDRGGDITYHGPGQLVAYPIWYLGTPDASGRLVQADFVGYLRDLEEALIRTIATFGVEGHREDGYTGVWVGDAKVAAIGVRINARGISTHGIALNVAPDLTYFTGIVPCGITDRPVTSLEVILGEACPTIDETRRAFITAFSSVFDPTETP